MDDYLKKNNDAKKSHTADYRFRKSQYTYLTYCFQKVMVDFNNLQLDYREKYKERIKRQLEISWSIKMSFLLYS
jgi:t-SNARE complex subunit (syntaxin)